MFEFYYKMKRRLHDFVMMTFTTPGEEEVDMDMRIIIDEIISGLKPGNSKEGSGRCWSPFRDTPMGMCDDGKERYEFATYHYMSALNLMTLTYDRRRKTVRLEFNSFVVRHGPEKIDGFSQLSGVKFRTPPNSFKNLTYGPGMRLDPMWGCRYIEGREYRLRPYFNRLTYQSAISKIRKDLNKCIPRVGYQYGRFYAPNITEPDGTIINISPVRSRVNKFSV